MRIARLKIVTLSLLSASVLTMSATDGIKVEHLSSNNAMVRVDTGKRYLLLPVEESCDDAAISLLVDGNPDKTINVRLAKSKIDYTVPLDLTRYDGHELLLNIVTPHDCASVDESRQSVCWNNFILADSFDTANREKYRQAFHHTPPYGWMNDPNGLFYKDGVWHLYYQWNPYGSMWQNMTWGHSTSTDLVNWEHHDAAIESNGLGMVFSGGSAVDSNNTAGYGADAVLSVYTSHGTNQVQSLAYSTDGGYTFTRYAGNPILTTESTARDPNIFWHDATGEWVMILAHAPEQEMLIYTSADAKEWTLRSSVGKGAGPRVGDWECPDLFELPVDGTDITKWVLVCNINQSAPNNGAGTQYFIGDFDGHRFTIDTDASGDVPVKWFDYGKDFYSFASWKHAPDNRRTAIAWLSNWWYNGSVPTQQFRSGNTLPREISLYADTDGEIYAASNPSPELEKIRGKVVTQADNVTVGNEPQRFALPRSNGGICEVAMEIDPAESGVVSLEFSNDADEKVVIVYDPANDSISYDRRQSGIVDFSPEFPVVCTAPLHAHGKAIDVRIFIDRASLELFANRGNATISNTVFPESPYTTMSLTSTAGHHNVKNLRVYELSGAI